MRIGSRPLHIALGAGHHNTTGGNTFETELNGRVCQAVVMLCRASIGFEVRCYTPDDGLGFHSGPVDEMPRIVALAWDPVWPVDVFHEIHAQYNSNPAGRGVFTIYPDSAGLASPYSHAADLDHNARAHGPAMAWHIARATGLTVGGPRGSGIMSERQTRVGCHGHRLRTFAATATAAMRAHSCRFITEVGCFSNEQDRAIMCQPDFPQQQAVGILAAYASLARTRLGWTYPYRIVPSAERVD